MVRHFNACPTEVQRYFQHIPQLAPAFPWEVTLSYQFGRVERAHRMALYCGAVKLHRADSKMARQVVEVHYLTRDDFHRLFETIHGKPIPKSTSDTLGEAERIRDRVMHGQGAPDAQQRKAIADVLDYATRLNSFVLGISGFRPFDDLRGFKGRGQALDKSTTRWLLRGMGFGA